VSVEDELWAAIKQAADNEGISMSAWCRRAMAEAVDRRRRSIADRILETAVGRKLEGESQKWSCEEIYEDALASLLKPRTADTTTHKEP